MNSKLPAPRPLILKLSNGTDRPDNVSDVLIAAGFQVVRTSTPRDALNVARRCLPSLFLVNDQPFAGLDAIRWIESQHSDPVAQFAVTPLIILAGPDRLELLRRQEIPERVLVIPRPPLAHDLVKVVKHLVARWAGA